MLEGNLSTLAPPADTADLVRAAAGADAEAWKTLVERYTRTVNRVASGYRLSEADAADVAQTVWLRLLTHIGRIRQPERIGGWVATTARHECLRLCREQGRTRLVDDHAELDALGAAPDPAPPAENEDRNTMLRGALDALPPRQRVILDRLMADPPTSYCDIASDLRIPIGSIGPTRQRTLRSLRTRCLVADVRPG